MKFKNFTFSFLIIFILCLTSSAQFTERQIPAEWENLVFGGRFMDRFLPMPVMGELTSETWGSKQIIPRYIENGIEDNVNSYWGGNAKLGDDGKYHLFLCGWPENSPKGHMFWRNSTVYHAVAENSFGPYKLHNETILRYFS
ncbi:MAG: hypothetical protein HOG79_13150 [Prolixibacteraceae bacterium]|jgi:hypothetical protein|nr:hypothetical protein [Prolixibacteraceae bacterium]